MTDITATPDLAAIKQRQQATWASGDYHMVGTQILIVSELLIEALDVHSTERVLDVDGPGIPRTPVRGDGLASATRPHAASCVEDGRRLRPMRR